MTGKSRVGLFIVSVAVFLGYCAFGLKCISAGSLTTLENMANQGTVGFPSGAGGAVASPGSAPPDAPPPPNRLSGVYAGMHFGYGSGASAGGELRFFAFYPDGTGMYLPDEGLDNYDLGRNIRAGLDPINYGTYQYHNHRVDFRSQDGTAIGFDINPAGNVPSLDTYVRTCHCNGARISGSYYWGEQGMTITFLPDGRFADRGAMHDCFQYNFYDNPHLVDPGVGTYRIVDYTIYLDYADGRHLKRSFVLITPVKTPEALWIGGARFKPAPGTIPDLSPMQINPAASGANPATSNVRPNTARSDGSKVLAGGSTPLTKEVAENFDNFLVWVFDIRLTPQEMELMERDLAASWADSPPAEIQWKLEMAELYARIRAAPADQQTQALQRLQSPMLQSLRLQQNDPICKMLLNAYETQHRGIATKP